MKNEYLEGGRICTAHGVAGALKLEHYCNEPRILAKQKRIFFKNGKIFFVKRLKKNVEIRYNKVISNAARIFYSQRAYE